MQSSGAAAKDWRACTRTPARPHARTPARTWSLAKIGVAQQSSIPLNSCPHRRCARMRVHAWMCMYPRKCARVCARAHMSEYEYTCVSARTRACACACARSCSYAYDGGDSPFFEGVGGGMLGHGCTKERRTSVESERLSAYIVVRSGQHCPT